MILPFLSLANIDEEALKIYEALLELGEVPASKVVAAVGMKRPTVYKILGELEAKGLVASRDLRKVIHFRPEPPTKLLGLAKQAQDLHQQAMLELEAVLPALTSRYLLTTEQPIVLTFDGIEGLKEMYNDQVKVGLPISALVSKVDVDHDLVKWLDSVHVRERAERGIHARVIVSSGDEADLYVQRNETELRTTKTVPRKLFPFAHEVDIYGNKVAFINYKKGETLLGIIIHHPLIAQTMMAFFDLAWIGADYSQS